MAKSKKGDTNVVTNNGANTPVGSLGNGLRAGVRPLSNRTIPAPRTRFWRVWGVSRDSMPQNPGERLL